jgi:DNA (cytosine-5)-methyltransferase 1
MPTFIDLFSGCGGFSLGLRWAGFQEKAAIDFNPEAMSVFKFNFPEMANFALEEDLQKYQPEDLEQLIGTKEVDLIVGGPPCQGFSTVRQRDGSNSGDRIIDDDRRELYQYFLRFVKYFNPKIFVMENVLGIRSAAGGRFFNQVQSEARELGYRVHGEIIRAWEYGVPQKRERQLIIGTQLDLPLFSASLYMPPSHGEKSLMNEPIVTLWEAIGDLPKVRAGKGSEVADYDLKKREKHLEKFTRRYTIDVLEVDKADKLTAHRARPHSQRDLRDFSRLLEGETSAHAIARGIQMEFPYNKETFKDRYTKQHRKHLCSTIVAHLSKDGLMFIHPTQNRSITPREAARIQSFPDWFQFPVARTHQFRLIGNAVPPLVGKAVGEGIDKWLEEITAHNKKINGIEQSPCETIDEFNAEKWLKVLVETNGNGRLAKLSIDDFKHGWFAIAYFYAHLHPDSALENGQAVSFTLKINNPTLENIDERLVRPVYERSGWPVFLTKFAEEARKRVKNGELDLADYYCSEIHILGHKTKRVEET